MAVSTAAFFLNQPRGLSGDGSYSGHWALGPEDQPAILWGQGTPGAIQPFTLVNKGSLYLQVDATDDTTMVWQKVDEGLDAADWVQLLTATTSGVNQVSRSALFDISAADSDQVVLHAKAALTITKAYLLWNEATAASGAAEGDITIGVTTGGNEVVAATAYTVSKATGSVSNLTIASGAVAINTSVFASHDQATGAAGTYFLFLEWDYD